MERHRCAQLCANVLPSLRWEEQPVGKMAKCRVLLFRRPWLLPESPAHVLGWFLGRWPLPTGTATWEAPGSCV